MLLYSLIVVVLYSPVSARIIDQVWHLSTVSLLTYMCCICGFISSTICLRFVNRGSKILLMITVAVCLAVTRPTTVCPVGLRQPPYGRMLARRRAGSTHQQPPRGGTQRHDQESYPKPPYRFCHSVCDRSSEPLTTIVLFGRNPRQGPCDGQQVDLVVEKGGGNRAAEARADEGQD